MDFFYTVVSILVMVESARQCYMSGVKTTLSSAVVAVTLTLVAAGCSAVSENDESVGAEAGLHRRKPAVCLADHAVCNPDADTCCAGTTCIEYTVYDHPRCMAPLDNGEFCTADRDCASRNCDEKDGRCAPAAPACRAPNDTCVVGQDTCCAGTTCIEYTVYDYPRCMSPRKIGETCKIDEDCASGICDEKDGRCAYSRSCRALGDTCVVGEDTCCAGSCVEYTIYDYPRCRE